MHNRKQDSFVTDARQVVSQIRNELQNNGPLNPVDILGLFNFPVEAYTTDQQDFFASEEETSPCAAAVALSDDQTAVTILFNKQMVADKRYFGFAAMHSLVFILLHGDELLADFAMCPQLGYKIQHIGHEFFTDEECEQDKSKREANLLNAITLLLVVPDNCLLDFIRYGKTSQSAAGIDGLPLEMSKARFRLGVEGMSA